MLTEPSKYSCSKPVRGMKPYLCKLRPNHKGYHAAVAFNCDNCDRMVRGVPYRYAVDSYGEVAAAFCFTCEKEERRSNGW